MQVHQARSQWVNIFGDAISFAGRSRAKIGMYIAAHPLVPEKNYFEVEILDTGVVGPIVGVVPQRYPLDQHPGLLMESVALHTANGKLYQANNMGKEIGGKCQPGDRVGCGVRFDPVKDHHYNKHVVQVFFMKNGQELGSVFTPMPAEGFHPAIGLQSEGEEVRLNLDADYERKDVILMSIDNCEEEWSRLHDVRVNGMMLEYTGRGKSITDVGLAQARSALDTTNHYFEIEIVDPGHSCYIAIGLARRDYPNCRHPGWNKGSIAYHADDGKIFIGSGVGDEFGPRCHKGDIMGCGILFPRGYSSEMDSDGSPDMSPDMTEDGTEEFLERDYHSSDSEDEEWWQRPYAEKGTKVQVFFTRNGKTIGRREIRIPKGGFYPTVGMLSKDEKVRVDLRPLTG